MMKTARFLVLLAIVSLVSGAALAQSYSNRSTCLDGAGDRSAGGSYSNISAIAQPGGVSVSRSGSMVNYAGFLNTFSLKPDQDTDGDGLDDEADADNDGDTLADLDEIDGGLFEPGTPTDHNAADSDEDGVADGDEAAAQTNPQDEDHYLHITSIDKSGTSDKDIEWVARSNVTYRVRYADDTLAGPPTAVLGTTTVTTPATGAWDVATGTYTDNSGDQDSRVYAVEPVQ